MLTKLSRTILIVFAVFVLVATPNISHGDDYSARSKQEYYYKIGWTQAFLENNKAGSKDAYRAALKLSEEDLIKYKQLKERALNERDYDNYKRQCECIAGAIRLIKNTSYLDMWKIISGKAGEDEKPANDGNLRGSTDSPNPRFVDNGNGTIADSLTGLVWLKNANCFGGKDWKTATSDANSLASGLWGLADGSVAGDWHLPEKSELESFVNVAASDLARWLNNHGFANVKSDWYWSSTVIRNPKRLLGAGESGAWVVNMGNGRMGYGVESDAKLVWPVRPGRKTDEGSHLDR